jgi:putative FmdB family regulatory protein
MPTYDYRCAKCGDELEVFQTFAEKPLVKHAGCGGRLAKVYSPAGIVLKGSGFYKTDNRNSSKRSGSGESENGSSKKSGENGSSSGSSEASGDSKSSDSGKSESGKSGSEKSGSTKSDGGSSSSNGSASKPSKPAAKSA